ncbi:hypothetical protein EDD22DRAFT_960419 [Suillus occidentalis]|nr:hypothetical protein EDD22DRAFT_960419 [Suillus occidentalis]
MADKVAKLVLTAVSSQIAKIQDASESISSTALHLNITATKLQDIAKATTEESPDSPDKPSSINSQLEKMQEAVTSLGTQIKDLPMQGGYKAALMTGLNEDSSKNPQLVQRAARNAIKARQILIDIPTDSPLAPGKVSHAQLTEKIKQALTTIAKEGAPDLETQRSHSIPQWRHSYRDAHRPGRDIPQRSTQQDHLPSSARPWGNPQRPRLLHKPEHIRNLEKENEWEENSITYSTMDQTSHQTVINPNRRSPPHRPQRPIKR